MPRNVILDESLERLTELVKEHPTVHDTSRRDPKDAALLTNIWQSILYWASERRQFYVQCTIKIMMITALTPEQKLIMIWQGTNAVRSLSSLILLTLWGMTDGGYQAVEKVATSQEELAEVTTKSICTKNLLMKEIFIAVFRCSPTLTRLLMMVWLLTKRESL